MVTWNNFLQVRNSLALGTSPIVRALFDPEGGMADVRKLDNISFADWFRGHGGNQAAIDRMWDPIGALPHPLSANLQCAMAPVSVNPSADKLRTAAGSF